MAEIALIACAKTKIDRAAPAAALYASALFRKSLLAALDRTRRVYILSAEHGLIDLQTDLIPYERTLKTMHQSERRAWGQSVVAKVEQIARPKDLVLLYAGEDYAKPLRSALWDRGYVIEHPLGARSLGARLQYLRHLNGEAEVEALLLRFDALIRLLSHHQKRGRRLAGSSGRQDWPTRGIYLVTEPVGNGGRDRVTRVGTHAVSAGSRTTLWNRISTHRGGLAGGGSHRSSIFRAHIGRALMRRHPDAGAPGTWGVGQSAGPEIRQPEHVWEELVSRAIGDMRMLWLDIPDSAGPRSDRAYLERNIIGLLSRATLAGARSMPDRQWLGHDSTDWRIAISGLWNLDYLFDRPDTRFLDVLEVYVHAMVGTGAIPQESLAPREWGEPPKGARTTQLGLFDSRDGLTI